ncbi:DUF2334 domain-containing protein [bacterium]|nr:DUF2334 domain-containing protein [bacterium]
MKLPPESIGETSSVRNQFILLSRKHPLSRFKRAFIVIIPVLFLFSDCGNKQSFHDRTICIDQKRFFSVRFDPSYYYDVDLKVPALCEELVSNWKESGINTVYVKVYDPLYGAVYKTRYIHNIQTDYGRLNLLKSLIKTGHNHGIQIFAWIPAFQHKQVWEAHPEWRSKQADETDYQPDENSCHLCVRNPEYGKWWIGFVEDLLKRYRDLDGVDIAEPVVSWKPDKVCYCRHCREAQNRMSDSYGTTKKDAFELTRSAALTSLIEETCRLVHSHGKPVSVTSLTTAYSEGSLYSAREQQSATGFDLEAVLELEHKPDIINMEILWQEWANFWNDTTLFQPEWTKQAVREVIKQVDNRSKLVIHVEMTPLGDIQVPDKMFVRSIYAALDGGAQGIDFYDSHQADNRGLWPRIKQALGYTPLKKILVYHDPDYLQDARQLEVLLRHFRTDTELRPLENSFSPSDLSGTDCIFYVGNEYRASLPERFIQAAAGFDGTVCWINENIHALKDAGLSGLGFHYQGYDDTTRYEIVYQGTSFNKDNNSLHLIDVDRPDRCHIMASARSGEKEVPYIVRSGLFWYVADLPSNYMTEGGRHIVFADLLHDILREDHIEKHLALVRIEDVNPTSHPEYLRSIADYLHSQDVPFSVGLTPFYLDPSENTAISISDRPDLTDALHYMVSRGGTVILHGCTHQYRGQSTIDHEFWDGMNNRPLFEDSEVYVEERLEKAINECFKNDIYPLVWETPHYAASQIDYRAINRFFSTCYERRQTVDVLGSDQLLPFYIPARAGKATMIPENLGYVPIDDPSPETIVLNAQKNLRIRDGFASFFFHPFVPLESLKQIIPGIQDLGYTFASIRSIDNQVKAASQTVISGQNDLKIDVNDQYFREFYLTQKGKKKHQRISEKKLSEPMEKSVVCPQDWLYVASALDVRDKKFPATLLASFDKAPFGLGHFLQPQPLKAASTTIAPLFIVDSSATGKPASSQSSLINAFEAAGIDYQTVPVREFLDIPNHVDMIIVPFAAGRNLSEQQILFILRALSRGLRIIMEKETPLSERIGIMGIGDSLTVSMVRDEYYPQVDIQWKEADTYRRFDVPIDYVTYYSEKNTGNPLVIGGEFGEGMYLYFATLFDPTTSKGYGRYPYYCDLLQRQFDSWPLVKRESAEIYFEPGDREDVSIEELVNLWKKSGFRTIYVAGWHRYPDWTYDYNQLIELAHQYAMEVYLWFELPHVNVAFWNEHPEWREKTATGEDAIIEWRHFMALNNPACLNAVCSELSYLIQKYDWDGINFAELYFSSPLGPDRPDLFTPMNASIRNRFSLLYGFDPVQLFDPASSFYWRKNRAKWEQFQRFRQDLVIELHDVILSFLHREIAKKQSDMEIVVTALDNIHARQTGLGTAMDTRRLIELGERLPFTLQIEDPFELWHLGPSRYDRLSRTYRTWLQEPEKLIFDINVVPYRSFKLTMAPTRQPTGLELYHFLKSASQDQNRVALYSESSIYMVDLPWISYALGQYTEETLSPYRWEIHTENTVTVDMDPDSHKDLMVNGSFWPAYFNGRLMLPPGDHEIESVSGIKGFAKSLNTTTRLVDISGELKSCRLNHQGIDVTYESPVRNYIIVNEKPKKIMVDNTYYESWVRKGKKGYSLTVPSGMHTIKIITQSSGSRSLRNFSIVSSVTLVLISGLAGFILLGLYITGALRRHRRNKHSS